MLLSAGLTDLTDSMLAIFFPAVCHLCEKPLGDPTDANICGNCRDSIKKIPEPFCHICGLPVSGLSTREHAPICGRCLSDSPAYGRARCAALHEDALRDAVLRFKYGKRMYIAKALAEILFECFQRHFQVQGFDLIIPIPIHRKRLRARGFNQSLLLAHRLSSHTGVRMARDLLQKTVDTPPQVRLGRKERITNIKGSFGVSDPHRITGSKILLIDDVLTTGATIGAAAQTLKRAKAARVDAMVLAYRRYREEEQTRDPEQFPE